ncbi:PLDc N-terminal domain-containing protein [Microbacterium sp. zg.Y1090]|uniref:PLDc N-terminal domain-containing protein n=1 Tax=Microbacterium TaxID=33882 RepID=UPI00214C6BC4|nr:MULTISPECIES: PLDc N-terminal domain-containing protein [unclassified Microbacterium]MCR2812064.1 PLDc N-terminal domain-containing protein [Microbacterium sp. zg.Y1084]MCR2818497.1 PLDc N-terminal domain-containing protein [Microbacterium sp. zg.Y1090]MDL5486310.1 PLDc N-terminal domain-containing protein [Microbacterium sp. zg-Y1211]WIM29712.1 PLDc N-terminal domain-containing protein [Microbacterium sp. zg-Y1090]
MRFIDVVEYQGFWGSFWDLIWWFLSALIFIAYLFALFAIISDLFRDHQLSGGWKAVWIFFLIFFPIITALVYLIARGGGMADRSARAAESARDAQAAYIQSVAGTSPSPSEEIAKAKRLLDEGTITPAEYESLKARALAG